MNASENESIYLHEGISFRDRERKRPEEEEKEEDEEEEDDDKFLMNTPCVE